MYIATLNSAIVNSGRFNSTTLKSAISNSKTLKQCNIK